jgi:GWxTD domain-containing protein
MEILSQMILRLTNYLLFLLIIFVAENSAAQSDSQTSDSLFNVGNDLISAHEYKEAKEVFTKILRENQKTQQALSALGKIGFLEEDWGDVRKYFNKILELDPGNLEALYYKGISYRETGVFKAFLLRKLDWDKSDKSFKMVISKDSSFNDVLYQYAKLLRYRDRYENAVRTVHTQIHVRPDLILPQVKIFRLYQYLINYRNKEKALEWLSSQPWDHAMFFIGEVYRREKEYSIADSIFQSLLNQSLNMPKQPIYLSLLRLNLQLDNLDFGENYYWRAVEEISNNVEADLVFEDLKYLVTEDELNHYRSIKTAEEKKEFIKTFWIERNPLPAARSNVRLQEHYRRMLYAEKYYEYDGFRTWFGDPDVLHHLVYPETNKLNHEFNDKGLIYIRHGEPNEKVISTGYEVPFNESWLYYGSGETPQMAFHFMLGKSGNDWRFAPIINNRAMLADRLGWGNTYTQLFYSDALTQLSYEEQMAAESRQFVTTALSTDRHTWDKDLKPLEMPFSFDTFRGENDKTILEFSYTIPTAPIAREIEKKHVGVTFEQGIAIHETNFKEVLKKQDTIQIDVHHSDQYIGFYQFKLEPDTFNVAFFSRPESLNFLGGFKIEKELEDYSLPGLKISDIQLASFIEPSDKESGLVKNGLLFVPNPSGVFKKTNPIYIYFEIYNLNQDEEDKTFYTIEYSLTALKERKKSITNLFGLLGRGKYSVTIQNDHEGDNESSIEYLAIDAGKANPGPYNLSIKIWDNQSGEISERSESLTIVK